MIKWHRLFGTILTDFFTGSSYTVEMELDLSLQRQFLDIAIIKNQEGGPISEPPDGLDDLAAHNLMTYKSFRQSLDAWAFNELIAYYVNYRKQQKQGPVVEKMPDESDFRFYAVSTRLPKNMQRAYTFEPVANGVYDVKWGSVRIRVIVPSQVSDEPKNALWLLFSAVPEKVRTGASQYRFRRDDLSTALNDLFIRYNLEGIIDMPYTVEDYKRESKETFIKNLPPENRLKMLLPAESLKRYPLEEIVKSVHIMFPELSLNEIEEIVKQIKNQSE